MGRKRKLRDTPPGTRFGRWTVNSFSHTRHDQTWWNVTCDCGTVAKREAGGIYSGASRSCGCLSRELSKTRSVKHGAHCSTDPCVRRAHGTWSNMKARCTNPNSPHYRYYGGRGITIPDSWREYAAFVADVGVPPTPSHTLDRIDNNAGYSKENCRWATHSAQMRNTRKNFKLEYNGEALTMGEWSERTGIPYSTIRGRVRLGWAAEKALTTPSKHKQHGIV